jgi:xanthine dehydrogenase accessory factor
MSDFYRRLLSLLDEGRRLAIATIVESQGSTPQQQGGRMIVAEGGDTWFSVGGGLLEARVIEEAKACLAEGRSALKSWDLKETGDEALGMVCGGRVTVYIEVASPPDELVIFGAGHVGRALARLAGGLGFSLAVVDDRAEMLDPQAFPPGTRFHLTDRGYRQNPPRLTDKSYVVLVTRSHDTDELALRGLLDAPAAYLGMIGSARKVRVVFERMVKEEGVPAGALERVYAPIGFPIGSHLPEEIAISIMAEIVAVRNGASNRPGNRSK